VLDPERTIEDGMSSFTVYYISESSDGVLTSDTTPVSSSTVGEHYVYDISDLRNIIAYIIVDGFVFYVELFCVQFSIGESKVSPKHGTQNHAGEILELINRSRLIMKTTSYKQKVGGKHQFPPTFLHQITLYPSE
jgi:hypothetical protein